MSDAQRSVEIFDSIYGTIVRGANLVYTGGTFDLLHVGHVNFLNECRKVAGKHGLVIVGLNTDDFVREYKGEHPINDYRSRRDMLSALRLVDAVVENTGGADSKVVLQRIVDDFRVYQYVNPQGSISYPFPVQKFIMIGSDWASKDYYHQMGFSREWLRDKGFSLLYVPYTPGISSSKLRRHIVD